MNIPTNYRFCIRCTDTRSGETGSFMYHKNNPFEACSPVFDSVDRLFAWMSANQLATGVLSDFAVYEKEGEPVIMTPQETLRHHVTGAIERGEKQAIVEIRA